MNDDLELFALWSDGDVDAGQELIRRYYDVVYFFFVSKLPDFVAADLTEETFEMMCAKADGLQTRTSFASYLLGIARWILVDLLGRRSHRTFDPITDSAADLQPSPSIITIVTAERRRASRLMSALRTLPLDDQLVLELQTYESLGSREIAEIVGVSHSHIATRLATAKRRLRRAAQEIPHGGDTLTLLKDYMQSLRVELLRQLGGGEVPPVPHAGTP